MPLTANNGTRDVIRIDGTYYDTKKLGAIHPGGELFVLISNGTDGTAIFNSSHRRAFPHDKYTNYVVDPKTVDTEFFGPAPSQKFDLYFEIAEAVKPLIKHGGFAPYHYYAKVLFILAAFTAFEVYFLAAGRTLIPSIVAGIFAAAIGLNIQHDANHGAVSRNGKINRALGLTQDLIGGSAMNWMISHDVVHHVHCNDTERDGDLAIPLVRLHEKVPWQMGYAVQQLYLWVLEALFGFVHVFTSAITTIAGPVGPQHVHAEVPEGLGGVDVDALPLGGVKGGNGTPAPTSGELGLGRKSKLAASTSLSCASVAPSTTPRCVPPGGPVQFPLQLHGLPTSWRAALLSTSVRLFC